MNRASTVLSITGASDTLGTAAGKNQSPAASTHGEFIHDHVLTWPGVDFGTTPPLLTPQLDLRAEEQYRIIRTKLLLNQKNLSTIVVSSPGPGDGKTVTAFQLAATFALSAQDRVLYVEADLRRPSLRRYLNVSLKPGLSEVLSGVNNLDQSLYRMKQVPNLWVLPAGDRGEGPAELLGSSEWRDTVATLRQMFRWIIIDSPPIGIVADFDLIHSVCDGVVLVVRPDHTDRTQFMEALKGLSERLIGIVLNGVQDWIFWKPYRKYDSYYKGRDRRATKRAAE